MAGCAFRAEFKKRALAPLHVMSFYALFTSMARMNLASRHGRRIYIGCKISRAASTAPGNAQGLVLRLPHAHEAVAAPALLVGVLDYSGQSIEPSQCGNEVC